MEELFLLTNQHEGNKYFKKEFKPSLVVSRTPTDTAVFDLLIFYIQSIAYTVNKNSYLHSFEIANILEKFYEFKYVGQKSIDDIKDSYVLNKGTWSEHIKVPHVTIIDIHNNWEQYARAFDVISTSSFFYREGLLEYIKSIETQNK